MKLSDDVRKDIVAFGNRSVNAVRVRSLRDGVPGEHGYCPTTARNSSASATTFTSPAPGAPSPFLTQG